MKVYRFKNDYHVNRCRLALVVSSFLYLAALNFGFVSIWLFAHGALLAVFYACKMLDISKQARGMQGKLKRSRFARWNGFITIFEFSFYACLPYIIVWLVSDIFKTENLLTISHLDSKFFDWYFNQVAKNTSYESLQFLAIIECHLISAVIINLFCVSVGIYYSYCFYCFLFPRNRVRGESEFSRSKYPEYLYLKESNTLLTIFAGVTVVFIAYLLFIYNSGLMAVTFKTAEFSFALNFYLLSALMFFVIKIRGIGIFDSVG